MGLFEQDRKIEREASAIVNFFVLLAQAELVSRQQNISRSKYFELFSLINGEEMAKKLIINCKEGDIDIFSNTVKDLYEKLEQNMKIIKGPLFSKSGLTEQTVKMFDIIEKVYSRDICGIYVLPKLVNNTLSAYKQLLLLAVPLEIIDELKNLKPVEKKIGER